MPPPADSKRYCRSGHIYPWVISVHLFLRQDELENSGLYLYIGFSDVRKAENLRDFKITIRYCDRMSVVDGSPFILDAKKEYYAEFPSYSQATDDFPSKCWGSDVKRLRWLKTFQLKLETTEDKQKQLDEIVNHAVTWRFPHNDGYVLVLNPARTKRTGWHGAKNSSAERCDGLVPNDPQEAKDRLVKDGVDLTVWDGEPKILDEDCMTYYRPIARVILVFSSKNDNTSRLVFDPVSY